MDDPHLQNAAIPALSEILGDNRLHVLRTKRVQVQHTVDREFDGLHSVFFGILSAIHVSAI